MTPVSVLFDDDEHDSTVTGSVLAFNDFHGNIDPPTGSGGVVNGVPAGGAEYLAYWVKKLRAEQEAVSDKVITVSAGDNVGASPLVSAAFHDEPAIEILNSLGTDLTSVGNHEFDEGVTELRRLQLGGCHPVDGCQDGDGFAGADFPILAANVTDKQTKLPILLPFSIKWINGVPVGFVGMTLKGSPTIVNPAGITTVDFRDEVETANFYAKLLGIIGIRSLVLVIHEGGQQNPLSSDPSTCASFAGAITPIVAGLRPEYGVVVSGHTHQWYSCALPNSSGANSVVTSAGSFGRLVTKITMTIDRKTHKFVSAAAQNQIVENGIPNGTGGWLQNPPGNFLRDPAKVDPQAKAIADKYRTAVAPLANKVVGSITADITRVNSAAGENALGDVIADGMLAYTAGDAQLAIMNPGGIRADLVYAQSSGGEAAGQVTYGEAFTVQPFNNPGSWYADRRATQGRPGATVPPGRCPATASPTDPADLGGIQLHVRLDPRAERQNHGDESQRGADRSGRELPRRDERLPGQRRRRLRAADGRHEPGHLARLRCGRARRPPRRADRADRTRSAEPDHQDTMIMFPKPGLRLARLRRHVILDDVRHATRFFYYGPGSPAAVGRA
jgi:5'-nucleotidase